MIKDFLKMIGFSKNPPSNKVLSSRRSKSTIENTSEKKSSKSPGQTQLGTSQKASSRASKTIHKREAFPPFDEILSLDGGELALHSDLQSSYLIVTPRGKAKSVIVVCANESLGSSGVDNEFLSIKERCLSRGYNVSQMFSQKQIIVLVIEDYMSKSSRSGIAESVDTYAGQFDKLLSEAIRESVSDIHFEVRKNIPSQVRFRIHGELRIRHQWSYKFARDISQVTYQVLADEKDVSFIESKQQSARIERLIDGKNIAIRLNTIPVSGGFDVVMRILKMDAEQGKGIVIADLGYDTQQNSIICDSLKKPQGVVIIAGTTGSGKSVSLSTMLNGVIRDNWSDEGPTIKVITVEDPTEYLIVGASQQGVVRRKGEDKSGNNPFAEAIKAALRCDPDIIMVGEVRDEHSATLLMQAVQTGHTALTTVHAGSAIGIVARLRSLGIPDDVLGGSDFITALMYQTLLQVVCRDCCISYADFHRSAIENKNTSSLQMIEKLISVAGNRSLDKIVFRNRSGCSCCVSGVTGRTVVAEIIDPTPNIRAAIERHQDSLALYHHLNSGGRLIIDHAIDKVLEGIADPFDVEKAVGLINKKIDIDELAESLGIKRATRKSTLDFAPVGWPETSSRPAGDESLEGQVDCMDLTGLGLQSEIFKSPVKPLVANDGVSEPVKCEVVSLISKIKKDNDDVDE